MNHFLHRSGKSTLAHEYRAIAAAMTQEKVLTPEAQTERDQFDRKYEYGDGGCTCFISPPCNWCTHPGNHHNQAERDECWMPPNAESLGVTWEDYCRERDRIKLASGGFAKAVWEGCDLDARLNMMGQLQEMRDDHFAMPKNWGTW